MIIRLNRCVDLNGTVKFVSYHVYSVCDLNCFLFKQIQKVIMYRGDPSMNKNGGIYRRGRRYDQPRKEAVALEYYKLAKEIGDRKVKISEVARRAKVGWSYAKMVVDEFRETAELEDPSTTHKKQLESRVERRYLTIEEEVYLLALRAEDPTRTNFEYISLLAERYGRIVSSAFISTWFQKRFEHPGNFKKPNVVPLDKWRPINISRYLEYRCYMEALPLHHLWCFLDEKHIVNKDTIRTKARADPLTGKMDNIPVSGDFRETYNLMAIVSLNPEKQQPIEYHIDQFNNDSASFMVFIKFLIDSRFFKHNEVLVLDNAAIHVGGHATNLQEILWQTKVDDKPLNVLVLFLPTRSPELNPIELIFHILAKRLRSCKYKSTKIDGQAVVNRTSKILDDLEYEIVLKCYIHCGY